MGLGLLLFAAALFLSAYNLWDEYRAERASRDILSLMEGPVVQVLERDSNAEDAGDAGDAGDAEEELEIPDYVLNPEMEMPTLEIDSNEYIGILSIPALELTLPIMDRWSYPRLKMAPCRYTGSVYTDDLVISGHNYRTHFSRLRELSMGDAIIFTDVDGNQFDYEVADMEVLEPTAIEAMTESDWDLTLFTCTYGGQTRFTLRCQRAEHLE